MFDFTILFIGSGDAVITHYHTDIVTCMNRLKKQFFMSESHKVTFVSNAELAEKKLLRERYDLIICISTGGQLNLTQNLLTSLEKAKQSFRILVTDEETLSCYPDLFRLDIDYSFNEIHLGKGCKWDIESLILKNEDSQSLN